MIFLWGSTATLWQGSHATSIRRPLMAHRTSQSHIKYMSWPANMKLRPELKPVGVMPNVTSKLEVFLKVKTTDLSATSRASICEVPGLSASVPCLVAENLFRVCPSPFWHAGHPPHSPSRGSQI